MGSKASHTWEAFCISWRINVGEKEQEQAKVVVITGGTSGVGLAAARRFLAGGASVCIAGRDPVRGAAAVRELLKAVPCSMAHVYFRAADVRDIAACQALMQAAAERYGRLDVLVNSAGVYLEGALGTLTEQQFDDVIDVNLKGTVFACQAALPYLRQTKGCIVNVGSDAGVHGNYNCTAYCAAKGGVSLFTRALALETAHDGVRVNAIAPGDLLTPLTEKQLAAAPDRAAALKEMASVYPVGRIGTADEAAAAICYLASDDAGFVTGTILSIDGGLTA